MSLNYIQIIIIIIIVIIILVITFIQGIYNYIPETNHVSRVYSVAAALFEFDVCVAVHLWYNGINNQLDATKTIY